MTRDNKYLILIALVLLAFLSIPPASGDTNVTFSQGLTFTTPYGLRLDFGLENYMPPAWAFLCYNLLRL